MTNTDHRLGLRTLGDQTWQQHAACLPTPTRPVDPDLFFPEPDEMDRIRAAKTLCAACPVRRTCLDSALENGDRAGIRGGMTEEEREPLHRNLPHRLDHARINATLAGRDVHLTATERRAVARLAYQAQLPPTKLARLLKVTDDHAVKLYRTAHREIRNRTVGEPQQTPIPAARRRTDELGKAA